MNTTVLLATPATPAAPALLLRPWHVDGVAELVEAYRDPALRRWAIAPIETEGDGLAWVRAQEEARAAGVRLGFAVVGASSGGEPQRLAGGVVLKELARSTGPSRQRLPPSRSTAIST
ncbi:GNAT family N-acetyltransferase [Streptomyces sp. NPDC056431]|uniref:GNAT family N-acetyltransferase n=1 Tax=Streptomyces sp. NPDC056431 TaxID=3345814 RepID=UPI003673C5AB